MFSIHGANAIDGIEFSHGAYYGEQLNNQWKVNGAQVAIMQSEENADHVIEDFEKAFNAGLNPNDVLREVMTSRNLTEHDFTDTDIERINRKVEKIYRAKKNDWRV